MAEGSSSTPIVSRRRLMVLYIQPVFGDVGGVNESKFCCSSDAWLIRAMVSDERT